MNKYFKEDEWLIIEDGFDPIYNRVSESIMSLGNGHMGMRGNFEEFYSGDSLRGTYFAGVYYTDKTKVGWWKNGYPEWFAKVLNGINFIGIDVVINGVQLDLAKSEIKNFQRVLDMQEGTLRRSFILVNDLGEETAIEAKRFLSISESELAVIEYAVTPLNYEAQIQLSPHLDGLVKNEDSNYEEIFWDEVSKKVERGGCFLTVKTNKLDFYVAAGMTYECFLNQDVVTIESTLVEKSYYVGYNLNQNVSMGDTLKIIKYVAVCTSRDYEAELIAEKAIHFAKKAKQKGARALLREHIEKWASKWKENDIVIQGDVEAQQAIRFNIFHLNQTYTGEDSRLNIGPKGFTGEKYGGSTYWDTEAYCIPFYLSTAPKAIARNLLVYRYNHLEKAKENARKLGFNGALYPMVTMNGEECHNEWEITFEEIHRNGAMAYAIFNYTNYTDDFSYLQEYGYEVLVEISRFWADRVNYQPQKDCYMILGVTGPNEYENNVNNNWYTNTMARWCLQYTIEVGNQIQVKNPASYDQLVGKLNLREDELEKFNEIIEKMYFPLYKELGIFEQQDGYMDKEQILVENLDAKHRPLNQNWSWDRILRSCFIKQADVLQGIFFFQHSFDLATKKRNYDFYEPRTVHESSLSPCIHSILACQIGYYDKAYAFYLRTARLDLDNYNNDTEDGLHITSMAGTWMSLIHGFGGLKIENETLSLTPYKPSKWKQFAFRIVFRTCIVQVEINENICISLKQGDRVLLYVYGQLHTIEKEETIIIPIQ